VELLLGLLHLLFDLSPGFVVGIGRNAFHLTALQQEDADDGGNNDGANVEPEVIFFLFHIFYLNRLQWLLSDRQRLMPIALS